MPSDRPFIKSGASFSWKWTVPGALLVVLILGFSAGEKANERSLSPPVRSENATSVKSAPTADGERGDSLSAMPSEGRIATEEPADSTITPVSTSRMANFEIPASSETEEFLARRRWIERNVFGAAAWAQSLPNGDARRDLIHEVALAWSASDPKAACEWARRLPDPAETAEVLQTVASEMVRTEPVNALRVVATLPATAERDETVRRAAMDWATHDAASALEWARQLPGEELRQQVLAGVAIAWSASDPTAAAIFAADELPPGRIQSDAVVAIVQRWAQQAPERAAEWVGQFPGGEVRRAAEQNIEALNAYQ